MGQSTSVSKSRASKRRRPSPPLSTAGRDVAIRHSRGASISTLDGSCSAPSTQRKSAAPTRNAWVSSTWLVRTVSSLAYMR
jgi:hypothetical protein